MTTGVIQIGRGVKSEVSGFGSKRRHKVWDGETGTWAAINLEVMSTSLNAFEDEEDENYEINLGDLMDDPAAAAAKK